MRRVQWLWAPAQKYLMCRGWSEKSIEILVGKTDKQGDGTGLTGRIERMTGSKIRVKDR